MDDKPWFAKWFNSPYYHLLYFKRDEAEAAKFINKLIDHLNPSPGSYMLDMACGRGRHARCLVARGFDVTGIDLSTDSIIEARKHESENQESKSQNCFYSCCSLFHCADPLSHLCPGWTCGVQ